MGNVMSAEARRSGGMAQRVGARMAALVLGAAFAVAPLSRAAVTVFVNDSGAGTVNKYVGGTLVGQIPAQGTTNDDKARAVTLGPGG